MNQDNKDKESLAEILQRLKSKKEERIKKRPDGKEQDEFQQSDFDQIMWEAYKSMWQKEECE